MYDSSDLDAIEELEVAPGFRLVQERIQATIEDSVRELERDSDAGRTAKIRGMLSGLRTALAIRDILKVEIKQHLEAQRHGQ